ncbi:MAG: hypothetical protein Q9227_001533 [Pyrenula ochraceoflavens]
MRERMYPLSKAKVRQSWNKYNLYNLARINAPNYRTINFFQQKWKAKSALRAYHAEHVREGQWEDMFVRRPRAVVPMDPQKMAQNDGSNESAGRGSGLQKSETPGKKPLHTPYMQMTFAPLERRLDIAIFRAMFASSARQARQFCVHGHVKVNGKTMIYPGYLLNPGDMFQVEPDKVLFATGQPKERRSRLSRIDDDASELEGLEGAEYEEGKPPEGEQAEEEEDQRDPREIMKSLVAQSKQILSSSDTLPAKRKQDLRFFQKSVKRALSSRNKSSSTILSDSLEAQFLELKALLDRRRDQPRGPSQQSPRISDPNYVPPNQRLQAEASDSKPSQTSAAPSSSSSDRRTSDSDDEDPTESDLHDLRSALDIVHNNPVDLDKPYATPWAPRDYMSAFAFIPRYLEVNQNICSAVYLRHPVARPGLSEVPTPFMESVSSAAFGWYLRRR